MKLGLLCCGSALVACAPMSQHHGALAVGRPAAPPPTEVDRAVAELAAASGELVSTLTIGASREGRPLHIIRLGAGGDQADHRPALLIVAGVDPMHHIGTEVAFGVARRLAADHPGLLADRTVYILPSLNPDTAEWLRTQAARRDFSRTLTPDDADRDGRTDEDGPADLNADGFITMMRIADPPPGSEHEARFMIDPADPRLLREPDRSKGERATHALIIESADADGDGRFAEDAPGGVDLDSNFPYRWPEYRDGAGRTPLSEPESMALAEWVLSPHGTERANILAVLVYSPVDNLINTPPAGRMDETGRVPLGIEEGDKDAYEQVGKVFKEITGMTAAPKGEAQWPGSLAGWAYGHSGVYAFTTPVWVRPDLIKKEAAADAAPKPDAARPDSDAPPEQAAAAATPPLPQAGGAGGRPQRGGRAGGAAAAGGRGGGSPAADAGEDAKWLAYFDERAEAADGDAPPGFIDWQPFDHPQLGRVEIGGFVPGAKLNPPASEIDRLVDEQTRFAAELLERLPRLTVEMPVVEALGEGVWRITVRVVNDGRLATRSAIGAKARRLPPIRLSLDIPPGAIIGGDRVQRTSSIPGGGGSFTASWIVTAPEGDDVTVQLRSAELGDRDITATLAPPARGEEESR